jgi:hypothetical protein
LSTSQNENAAILRFFHEARDLYLGMAAHGHRISNSLLKFVAVLRTTINQIHQLDLLTEARGWKSILLFHNGASYGKTGIDRFLIIHLACPEE